MREAFIFLGPKCNLKCKFCYSSPKMRHLDTSQAKAEIKKYLNSGYDWISFTGGEPTIRNDLPELIKFAKMSGAIAIKVQTNGLLTSNINYLKQLKTSGLTYMYVSIQSHAPQRHDFLTNRQGSFSRAIQTIKNCIELKLPLELGFVVTKVNYKDMFDFLKFIHANFSEVEKIQFLFECPSYGALDNLKIIPKLSEIELCLYKALDYAKKKGLTVFTRGIPLCYLVGYKHVSVEYLTLSSKQKIMVESLTENIKPKHSFEDTNVRPSICGKCKVKDICGGVWRAYVDLYGFTELFPKSYNFNDA